MHTYLLKNVGKSLELPPPRRMEYEWKDTSASEISRKTRILAANHYVSLGHIVDYVSVEGARTPYVPTEADIGLRDQLAASRLSLFTDQERSLVTAYSLISGALTALVLGLVLGQRSRKVDLET